MTTINTIQDLIRILDENPEWMEAVRARVLPRRVLDLPDTLDQLSEEVRGLAAETRAFAADTNRRFELVDKRFDETDRRFELADKRFDETDRRFDEMDKRFDWMDRRFDLVDKRFDRMENNISRMKSGYAERKVVRQADIIADQIGLTWVRNLEYEEIKELVQHSDTSGMTPDDIKSFRNADLIVECRSDGGTYYVSVEVAFTATTRDTDRALRNARYMSRFTGCPARPAVAGMYKGDDVRELFALGTIHWYQLWAPYTGIN